MMCDDYSVSLGKQTRTSLSLSLSLTYTTWCKQASVALLCCFFVVKLNRFPSIVGELERSNPGRGVEAEAEDFTHLSKP
jgi:hypothetical protein